MKLWLDDVRKPPPGFTWVKTYEEAVELLRTGEVTFASLDHDLGYDPEVGYNPYAHIDSKSGYDVICWMEEHGVWPEDGVAVHSMNPVGAKKMRKVIEKAKREGHL